MATTKDLSREQDAALPDSLRIAAIDVGSNSVHMIVAQVDSDGGITTLWRMKEMVGLGRISFPSQSLTTEAMDRAVASLGRMKLAAQQRSAEKIVAVATSAIREAGNGGDLIRRIKDELRLYLRVVSAREEARLIYLGVRSAVELGDHPHAMIDIGGGSVEFIVGNGSEAKLLESRKLGAARMTARFVKSDPISKADLAAMQSHYEQEIAPLAARMKALKPVKCLGTSGTLENIADLCEGGRFIEFGRLKRLEEKLIKTDAAERANIRGLDDQRKDQIVAGVVLVRTFMEQLELKQIELCGAALREGILHDYLSRHIPDLQIRREIPDPRRRSVLDLARRCNWAEAHSTQVARLMLRLFDDLKPLHGYGDRVRELFEYGAWLHDIGWHIAPTEHHKHGAYLIRHGNLKQFTESEIEVMAALARFHRKEKPSKKKKSIAHLKPADRHIVAVGVALLRVADGLDRSHAAAVQDLKCTIGKSKVTVDVIANTDIQLELWAAREKAAWFEDVFHRTLDFERA
ncbi:MAG: Ppx/GppA phosphatase family protein [Tepidisphaeraceae bacterium]